MYIIYIHIHTGCHIAFPNWLGWWYGVWKQRCVGRTLVGCCGTEVSTSTRAFTLLEVWRGGAEAFQDLAPETSMNHNKRFLRSRCRDEKCQSEKTHRKDKVKETQFNDYCFMTWNNHQQSCNKILLSPTAFNTSQVDLRKLVLPQAAQQQQQQQQQQQPTTTTNNQQPTTATTTNNNQQQQQQPTKKNEVSIQIQVTLEIKMSQWCNLTWKEIEVADGCFGKRFLLCLVLFFFQILLLRFGGWKITFRRCSPEN